MPQPESQGLVEHGWRVFDGPVVMRQHEDEIHGASPRREKF
jgi:hypothetical protein